MIRKFKDEDIKLIYPIVYKYWKDELRIDEESKEIIYSILSSYYYKNRDYSYILENEKAFLFASKKVDIPILEIMDYGNSIAKEYIKYLEYNNEKVKAYMGENSLSIGLVASITPKGGRNLLKHIEEVSKKESIDSIYLWTDETCNYSYYEGLGYKIIEEYVANMIDRKVKTFIFRLEIKHDTK